MIDQINPFPTPTPTPTPSLPLDMRPKLPYNPHKSINSIPKISTLEYVKKQINEIAKIDLELLESYTEFVKAVESDKQIYSIEKSIEINEKLKLIQEKRPKNNALLTLNTKVNTIGFDKIIEDKIFASHFLNKEPLASFVISIDIRKSTDLMLWSNSPKDFEDFMSTFILKLMEIVKENFGIIDKFTGDGILAYFPDFYSGIDSAMLALKTAFECHQEFTSYYEKKRTSFNVAPAKTGLGIGIDYGDITIINFNDTLTILGKPVVYACRFSGEEAGSTILNQGAYSKLLKNNKFFKAMNLNESIIKTKEGEFFVMKAYQAEQINTDRPDWIAK